MNLKFITNSSAWKWVVNVIGNIRIYKFGIVILGETSYHIKGPHVEQIMDIIQPGDVLLRRYDHYIGGLAIPGFWTHAAQYVGDNRIIHMIGKGINEDNLITFLRCDHVCILRCNRPDLIPLAIKQTLDFYDDDIEYDYNFDSDDENLYCSEMIYLNFDSPTELTYGKYILPDNIHCTIFDPIWINQSAKDELQKRNIITIPIEGS